MIITKSGPAIIYYLGGWKLRTQGHTLIPKSGPEKVCYLTTIGLKFQGH